MLTASYGLDGPGLDYVTYSYFDFPQTQWNPEIKTGHDLYF